MTKNLILTLTLMSLNIDATGQKVYWSSEKKLQWSDFIEANPKHITVASKIFAVPYIGLEFWHETKDDSIHFRVQAFFVKDRSWKRSGQHSYLLKHERLHFDISEYVARLIREEIMTTTFTDDFSIHLSAIREKYTAKLNELQSSFDGSTNHGNKRLKEKKWRTFIQLELERLSSYQKTVVRSISISD